MTIDEQTIILDIMQKNGFALINSGSKELDFQKNENDESFQVTLLSDFPYYVKSKYTHADMPDKWAIKTDILKNFDRAKVFAENGVNEIIDNLRQEFNKQLRSIQGEP